MIALPQILESTPPCQAISMMGARGVAKKVEFNPVRAEDVELPEGATFVIANSLAVSNKAIGAHRRRVCDRYGLE